MFEKVENLRIGKTYLKQSYIHEITWMHVFPEVSSKVAFENISYKASELNVINVPEFTLQMNIISFYTSSALFQFFALVHPTF